MGHIWHGELLTADKAAQTWESLGWGVKDALVSPQPASVSVTARLWFLVHSLEFLF